MFNYDFNISAVFITIIEIILFYSYKNSRNAKNTIYVFMLHMLLISAICDVVSGIGSNSNGEFPVNVTIAVNYIYFLAHNSLPMLFAMYNVVMTARTYRTHKVIVALFFMPYIIDVILILTNPFTGLIFNINSDGVYLRGSAMYALYFPALLYFIFIVYYITRFRTVINRYTRMCVYLFIVVSIIPIIIQAEYPYVPIEVFSESLCFFLIYANVQKRDELMDGSVGTFNRKAFMDMAKVKFQAELKFSVISVSVDESSYLEKTFGMESMNRFTIMFAEYLNSLSEKYNVYHIGEYDFYIVSDDSIDENVVNVANEIVHGGDKNWIVDEVEIPIDLDVCIIECPEDISNINQIFECTEYISNEEHGHETRLVYAKEVNSFYGKRKSQIKHAIHRAIRNDLFQVYYQPIYSVKEKRINSAEALVRLNDEKLGFISPEEFIPIAEEDGSILKIGNFVLESVCKFLNENDVKNKGIDYVEVNVSVIECMKQNMPDRISGLIEQYGIRPEQINLEITETATANTPQMMETNMRKLVENGVKFSLDDYGSGYSNMNYLIGLPLNLIKMDKSIVWSSFKNDKAFIALESSVSMIRKLDYKIVAEGVETEIQAKKLAEMGCEYLQGYYFSKPLPKDRFLEYINNVEFSKDKLIIAK